MQEKSSAFGRLAVIGLATVMVLMGSTLLAQERTGTIYGKVTDPAGLVVPGAIVTITSPQLIKASEVRTVGETGEYRVPLLPPGVYTVKVEIAGFQPMAREGIELQAGAALAVDFLVRPSDVKETVTVVGDAPLVDLRNSQNTRTLDAATLKSIPVGRNFSELIKTASGVIDGEYNFAPVQAVHGSTVRDNVYNVDGAGATDTTVGYMTTEIPYDMIEEVQVTTSGTSAEFTQGGGAVFNFITKSGGNKFSGGLNFYGEGGSFLTGDNLDDKLRSQGITKGSAPIKNLEYGGSLGGPILKDRLWFFGNLRWLDSENAQPDFPVQNKQIQQRQSFVKITSQIRNLRLYGSYTEGLFHEFVDQGDFTIVAAPENWRKQNRHQKIVQGGANYIFGQSTYLEARASRSFKGFDPEFPNNPTGASGFIDTITGLNYGGHTRPDRLRKKMDQGQVALNLSHFQPRLLGGSHEFKAGFLWEYDPYEQAEVFYDGQDLLRIVRNRVPFRVRLYNTPVSKTATNVTIYAGYFQDQWTIKDRLSLNLGLRYETAEGWTPDQEVGGGRWFPRTTIAPVHDLLNLSSVSPRLGFVWTVDRAKRTSVRASYGRYFARLLVGNVPNPIGSDFQEYDWNDNGDQQFQLEERGTLRRAFRAVTPAPKDPNLKLPYTDGFNVGFDRQLGSNLSVSVAGIVKRERDIQENIDLARPFSAFIPITVTNRLDGTPMTIYTLDPAFQALPSVTIVTNPTNPVPLKRDYRGVEFVVRKRMSDGWHFLASLNLGRSKGNVGTSFGYSTGSSALYNNPNSLINVEGPLDLDSPVQIKLSGGWQAPGGILLSGYYAGLSGIPIHPPENFPDDPALGAYTLRYFRADNPLIVVESVIQVAGVQRGTYRQDFRHKLSLRAEKELRFGSYRITLLGDVFNLLNINTVTAVQTLKTDLPNFLAPARIEPPRSVRLGLRLDF
jgi:outer membrane receptor protein involved in Fe transport